MELSTDVTTVDSLLSSASDAATPIPNRLAQAGYCRDLMMRTPPAYCPADRRPSTSTGNGVPENPPTKNPITPRRKSRRNSGHDRSGLQQHGEHNALVVKLQSELAATRSELERKDILATSLQHQLDQRRHTEEQTQARSEQDLTVALAEASALKKELERTSQLLMDGAVARQQLEQRCSVLKQELEQSDARAKELEQEVFEARVQITKVSNELYSRRNTSLQDAEITFAQEVRRVEAKAKREIDALRERAGTLREALERRTSLYEEACSERDIAVREAKEAAENFTKLRQELVAEAQADAKSAAEIYMREQMALLMQETKATIRQQAETLQAEMKADSDAAMRETIRPLLAKLRKSEVKKKEHYHRAKALEAENGRLLGAIEELHDSTMAVVLQAGISIESPR